MEELLTAKELSLKIKFSKRTIYDWVHVGFIPHYKFPKGVRFKLSDIEGWLKKKKGKGRSSYRLKIE